MIIRKIGVSGEILDTIIRMKMVMYWYLEYAQLFTFHSIILYDADTNSYMYSQTLINIKIYESL